MSAGGDDDITTGELARNLQAIRTDISQWRSELTATLAGFVTLQLYQSEIGALRSDMARIEAQSGAQHDALKVELEAMEQRQERWKLAFFSSLAAPIIVALIVGAIVIRGAG